jgi:hypothetical protein
MLARSRSDDEQRATPPRARVKTSCKRDVADRKKAAASGSIKRTRPGGSLAEDLPVTVRRGRCADRCATQAADDGASQGISGRSTNQRTATGADGTAGQRALSWRFATSGRRQRQGSAHNE